MTFYYFGCIDQAGHYLWSSPPARNLEEHRALGDLESSNPWGYNIDSGLCPKGPEIEGRALLHKKDGWTIVSFWDRSVDSRGKCNSNFLCPGDFTFEQMISLACQHFPQVMNRFSFSIVEVKE